MRQLQLGMDGESSLAEEDLEQEEKPLPKINVLQPMTHDTLDNGKFTSYKLSLVTDHPSFHLSASSVRRRFSEMHWLYRQLRVNLKTRSLPKPPRKTIFAPRFDTEFINQRQVAIEKYLNEMMKVDTVLSDFTFHLFVQTDLTTREIESYFQGTLSEDLLASVWQRNGHLHGDERISVPYEPQEIVMNEEDRFLNSLRTVSSSSLVDSFSLNSDPKPTDDYSENTPRPKGLS
ncbi:sorting nexin-10B isoform X2 [Aplysia californica]|uniref:Sorting nexin-10B isoform X2 n=1 Tax=Aplysia californica TaxID=6500 RepID=A0ABM0ZZK3_APLCA|nr:sorting nexin-10B isoform X2 [Aplysia californica]